MLAVASVVVSMPSGSGTPALHHRAEDPAEALEDRVLDDALDDRDLAARSLSLTVLPRLGLEQPDMTPR